MKNETLTHRWNIHAGRTKSGTACGCKITPTKRNNCLLGILAAAVASALLPAMATAGLVVLEAESGALGADWVIHNDTPSFISIASADAGTAPGTGSRLATFSAVFPAPGRYNLYARVRVEPDATGGGSFFYANGFGNKPADDPEAWILCSGLIDCGFTNPVSVVAGVGEPGLSDTWKWVSISDHTGTGGEPPVRFDVPQGNLALTFQIGGRGTGLGIDKLAFAKVGYALTVSNLDTGTLPAPLRWLLSVPELLQPGSLIMSMYANPGFRYAIDVATSLVPPIAWTPLVANSANSQGLVVFTSAPAGPQRFYRARELTSQTVSYPPPLAYPVENTGADCPPPPLPTMANLPVIHPLPDPFMWSATNPTNWAYPTGRSTNFADWRCRRAEIKAEIEHYEIGPKPTVDLNNVFASYSGTGTTGTLTVRVTNFVAGTPRTLTLTCAVRLPTGSGPFPVVIGMNSPSGSIPETIFSSRNIARITYSHNQVTVYGSHSNSDPFYQLYPHLNTANSGQYAAWAWGVSRIIDGLYKLEGQLGTARINLERIAVTGCSYAGKMALFAGALDERIALTIAQEPGGGGAAAWRVSETLGNVEKLGATDRNWF
ncbi:MAG: hypothetical protein NZ739_05395 [Verrucomicrobiae bacterium]|nr:hypothetical protein [Verrucomicrobiae bacterium]